MIDFIRNHYLIILFCIPLLLSNCQIEVVSPPDGNGNGDSTAVYRNVTSANLPNTLTGISRDAKAVDIDGDSDLDLIIAVEDGSNRSLINNGQGVFSDETNDRLPPSAFNGRDIAVADFNQDGRLDLFFANANPPLDDLFLNNGSGFFSLANNRITNDRNSNAAIAYDFTRNGAPGLLLGNIGQNFIFINNGQGFFTNQTGPRIPLNSGVTNDLELADIDNDGDRDLLIANKKFNKLYINTGNGFYVNQTESRLPTFAGQIETRDIELADINKDGDLDIYLANVIPFQTGTNAPDRLLINSGQGVYVNGTQSQLPFVGTNTLDAEFLDIDSDGDADILAGILNGGLTVLINDGSGIFTNADINYFPENISPQVVDFELADFNGDDLLDIYIATFQQSDLLLLREKP